MTFRILRLPESYQISGKLLVLIVQDAPHGGGVKDYTDLARQHLLDIFTTTCQGARWRIKTRKKPATKAGKREMFGKVVLVKAKPAKTVVKAFAAKALKDEF